MALGDFGWMGTGRGGAVCRPALPLLWLFSGQAYYLELSWLAAALTGWCLLVMLVSQHITCANLFSPEVVPREPDPSMDQSEEGWNDSLRTARTT